ncbi:MAG: hypothetical protein AAGN66_06970 [Acidobacteriota bacterium]
MNVPRLFCAVALLLAGVLGFSAPSQASTSIVEDRCAFCSLSYAQQDIPCGWVQLFVLYDRECGNEGELLVELRRRTPWVDYWWVGSCADTVHTVNPHTSHQLANSVDPCGSGSCPASRTTWPPPLDLPPNPPADAYGIWRTDDGEVVVLHLDREGLLGHGVLAFVHDESTSQGTLTVDEIWARLSPGEKPAKRRWTKKTGESGLVWESADVALISQDVVTDWMLVRSADGRIWEPPTVEYRGADGAVEVRPHYKLWTAHRKLPNGEWTSAPSEVLREPLEYLGNPDPAPDS